jgi:hypothetical protein
MINQKITYSQYKEAQDIVDRYHKEQKLLNELGDEPRYFVDIRTGCGAIRDRLHPTYDETYPGLHHDTKDVIEYIHGYTENGVWIMKEEDLDYLHKKCQELNND